MGVQFPAGAGFFFFSLSPSPVWLWDPPSLLSNGYDKGKVFPVPN